MTDSKPAAAVTGSPGVDYATWRQRVVAELGGGSWEGLAKATLEGIPVEPLYTATHPAADPLPRPLRPPGPWRIWQEVPADGGGLAGSALAREVDRDLGGVWIRADEPGALDDLSSRRLAGLLAGLPLDRLELTIEGTGQPLATAALLLGAARRAGIAPEAIGGCLGCDPLGAMARHGVAAAGSREQLATAARWSVDHAPAWRSALVSGAPYHDAGADAVLELAFVVATAREYLGILLAAGLSPDQAAGQLLLSVPVSRDVYLQVAKLRALRLLGSLVLDAAGAQPARLRIHARTSWRTKTRLDPATDLVRVTLEALAAVVGGCDDLTCAPFLDPQLQLELGLPLASATQLLLRDEAGLGQVLDPAGGSWYVEGLTAQLAERAWGLAEEIERSGGMSRALGLGLIARRVEEASERRLRAIARRELTMTGISSYPTREATGLPHRPRGLVARPEPARAASAPAVPQSVVGSAASLPALFAAAAAGASFGDLVASWPAGGEPLRAPALPAWRDAVPFEAVRRLASARAGGAPSAALILLAPTAATLTEADLARQTALAGGLRLVEPGAVTSATEAAATWRDSGADAAVLVPSRRTPAADVAAAATALRRAGCPAVVAVGAPTPVAGGAEGPHLWISEGGEALALLQALLGRLAARRAAVVRDGISPAGAPS
jgi:methylmalonyl-CoA mutase